MLKAGFIGFGRMGITHFSILNCHPEVNIVAVADPSTTTTNILKKYVGVKTYADYKQMLDEQELDFVVVSTPADSHAEIIQRALDHDLHIFAEKPFALTIEEGQETLKHLAGKSLVNQVGYVNRFNEVFMEIKKLLDAGVIGEIKTFNSEMYGPTVLKDSKSGWRGKRKLGGGCMYEFASHCIDVAVFFAGKPDKVVGSVMQSIYSSDVEDLVSSTFLYNKGYSGTINVNWSDEAFRKPTNIVTIIGDQGKIVADKHAYKIFLKQDNDVHGFHKGWNTRYITEFAESVRFYVRGNEFTRQLDYFVDCVKNKRMENVSSFEDAFVTDSIMEQVTLDAARSLAKEEMPSSGEMSPILSKPKKSTSFWTRLMKLGEKVHA